MTTGTDDTPGLSGAIRELIAVCQEARMAAEAPAASLDERVSGSKPGSAHLAFVGGELPVSAKLERSIRRMAEVYRRQVRGGAVGVVSADTRSAARKAQTRAILGEVGMDPTALAFVYGMTTESVRKLRGRHGRDPETGQRLAVLHSERVDGSPTHAAPLTAPPRAAQERLEERHADGEVGR